MIPGNQDDGDRLSTGVPGPGQGLGGLGDYRLFHLWAIERVSSDDEGIGLVAPT